MFFDHLTFVKQFPTFPGHEICPRQVSFYHSIPTFQGHVSSRARELASTIVDKEINLAVFLHRFFHETSEKSPNVEYSTITGNLHGLAWTFGHLNNRGEHRL